MRARMLAAAVLAGCLISASPEIPAARGAAPKSPPSQSSRPTARRPPTTISTSVARFASREAGGTVRLGGVGDYRGTLELRRGPAGIGAVNEVPFEDYLKGIAEMPNGWPAEALRAQAIAARTYALYVLENGLAGSAGDLAAQICATEGCQVYAGLAKEQAPGGENWAAAVEATRGQVLLHQGKAIQAKYSSSNGGRSVAGGKPYLKAVDDPDDAKSPLHRWALDISFEDLGRALGVPGTVDGVGREPAGGVVVAWTGAGGASGQTVVSPADLRARVNTAVPPIPPPPGRSRVVPSALFTLAVAGRTVHLDGRGYGHGLGMSQWGAYGKAQRGLRAAAILAAYYGGIKPTAAPAGRLPGTVRVAVDPGRPELSVSAVGPFRVSDLDGRVVAEVASGTWRVLPGGRGLRLVPPAGQAGPATLQVVGIDPPSPGVGQPATVRFRAGVPGLVGVTVHPPGGVEARILAAQPTGPEEVSVVLPPAQRPGAYLVWLTAEAGSDRAASQTLMPQVVAPESAPEVAGGSKWTPPEAPPGPRAIDRPLAARVSRSAPAASPAAPAAWSASPAPAGRWASFAALAGGSLLVVRLWSRRRRLAGHAPTPPSGAEGRSPASAGGSNRPG